MQNKKNILITGGAGFIGSHCVDLFLQEGYRVGVFDIKKKNEAHNLQHCMDAIEYIQGDITCMDALQTAMPYYDQVLHLAADVSVPDSFQRPSQTHNTNVNGTLNVFIAASEHGVQKMVYASSAAVYGNTTVVPTDEAVPLVPMSPYGVHKQINEIYGRLFSEQYNLPSTGLRFFNVYGSRQDPSSAYSGVISIFYTRMKEGNVLTVHGDGSATRDFVHVHDIARACLLAMQSPDTNNEVYNIGTGHPTSINELIETLQKALHSSIPPTYAEKREGDIMHSCAQTDSFTNATGFVADMTLPHGIQELIDNS